MKKDEKKMREKMNLKSGDLQECNQMPPVSCISGNQRASSAIDRKLLCILYIKNILFITV